MVGIIGTEQLDRELEAMKSELDFDQIVADVIDDIMSDIEVDQSTIEDVKAKINPRMDSTAKKWRSDQ
ncbi:MAG: hypothetical protein AAF542_19450 [Pseudomonadota bacterium]